ncbi:DUF6538 domain-containing protein [Aurantimonas sp. A2-1-M11]|uniref:DUF6538 domain-containing protein n=1 Tax=Aurantimonas sp. A2-1-M11 TaxID=3113712 RepID=UPI002F95C8FF
MEDDSVLLPSYVTSRNGVFQYVRRVPDDVADVFAGARIQRSLKTRLPSEARQRAAQLDADTEQQFAEARRRKGVAVTLLSTSGWTWNDWQNVIEWLKASWLWQDQATRLRNATGAHFSAEATGMPLWLDAGDIRKKLDLRKRLLGFTVSQYAADRSAALNAALAPISIAVPIAEPTRVDFMAVCLKSEIEALEIMFRREAGEAIDYPHPDTVAGPWRAQESMTSDEPPQRENATSQAQTIAEPTGPQGADQAGRALSACIDEWKKERVRLKKKVDDHLVNDMRNTVGWFSRFSKVRDVKDVRRHHIIAFRDHLLDAGRYKTATINKKVGFLTTLMSLAAQKGWVDRTIDGGIYIDIPGNEDRREPYSAEELALLFAGPIFTQRAFSKAVKAGGDLQFWLPLISCCHGMISSEIMQLGPDTIEKHPESDVWCFRVTNAGGRTIKAYSRERYVPIRTEFLELGILDLVDEARRQEWATIWPALATTGRSVVQVSNYFSAHWTSYARRQLGSVPAEKSLYSFRHAFKDELDRMTTPIEVKQALLGHSDVGTTGRYGRKRKPRAVQIEQLASVIDAMQWPFLGELTKP